MARSVKGAFRLEDHIDCFERSMEHLRLSPPNDRSEIRDILIECVRLSGLRDAYAEVICTRGIPRPGSRDPRDCENRFYAFVVPFIWVADPEKQQRGLHAFQIRGDLSGRPVHGDPLSCLDEFCGVRDADDGRYAVLAGNDGAVGHRPAHLHNEAARGEEEGRPTGVCRGRYQDLTRLQAGFTRVQDHTRFLCHHPA
jgi:hypothetical protein